MKRTTLFVEERLLKQAQSLARKRGVSFATVVREALAAYVVSPAAARPLPSVAGKFASGQADTSERVDELLWRDPHG